MLILFKLIPRQFFCLAHAYTRAIHTSVAVLQHCPVAKPIHLVFGTVARTAIAKAVAHRVHRTSRTGCNTPAATQPCSNRIESTISNECPFWSSIQTGLNGIQHTNIHTRLYPNLTQFICLYILYDILYFFNGRQPAKGQIQHKRLWNGWLTDWLVGSQLQQLLAPASLWRKKNFGHTDMYYVSMCSRVNMY